MSTATVSRFRKAGRFLGCLLAFGVVPDALGAAPGARFTRLSVEQGLSQTTVQAVLQDHVGFLWFGTEEGVNRYDGYGFVVFRHDPQDPQSLPDNLVSALYEDGQRRLWVGTGNGLGLFDRRTETFTRIPSIREKVSAIVEDPDGTLWVGTNGKGLFERDPGTGSFRVYERNADDPASLGSSVVSALLRDRRGRIWIGFRDGGLDLLERDGRRFRHYRHDSRDPGSLAHDEVWGLAEDAAGNLWVATYGGGLSVLDHEKGRFRHYRHRPADPHGIATDLLTCVFVGRSGTIWVGTDGAGVHQYDAASGRFLAFRHDPADPASLSSNVIRSLYEDAQGQIWVGTHIAGVNAVRKPRLAFGYLTHRAADPSSVSDLAISSFLEDTEGRIWVGTQTGWLNRYDRRTATFVRYRFPSALAGGSAILSLHQDRRGRIWVGTYRGGLGRFDPQRGTFFVYRNRPGDPRSLSNDEVWAISEDPEAMLWLGNNARLDRFDPDLGAVTATYESLSAEGQRGAGVRSLVRSRDGHLWVGTFGGLNLLRRGGSGFVRHLHRAGDPRSLSHDWVVALHEDGQGVLWAGTYGGGLNRLDPKTGTFTSYKRADGLPSDVVYGILEDSSGLLWLSTNQGLSRFDPRRRRFENFDLSNGLQSLQFGLGASLKTRDGRLLFGSDNGFYDFDPAEIKPDPFVPPVVFTSVRVFNEPLKLPAAVSTLDEITLSHRDRSFSVEFAALDFLVPRRNRYAYKMEGFSDQWIQLGAKHDVTLAHLDPGTYVFHVKASNSDGVWSEKGAALRMVIRPPFWATWWFRGMSAATIALLLLAAHRLRVSHLTADLAERKRAEAALRQAEEKYRGIFENSLEGIFQTTPDGRFLTANPALARMLGYSSPEQVLAEVTEITRQLWVEPARRQVMARLLEEKGVLHGLEYEMRRRDGSTLWVSVNVRVVRDEGGSILYYEGTTEDISDRRRAGELEKTLRRSETFSAMGSMLAGVAHEVRNPLFGISATLDAFESRVGSLPGLEPLFDTLRKEVGRVATLMRQLLDHGKPAHESPSPAAIDAVVAEAVESCASLAQSRSVRLVGAVSASVPAVAMDRGRMVQVFQNLIQNAIQLSPPGGVVAVEAVEENGANGSSVAVIVKDSGPGFVPDDLPRIFEPFFSRRRGGTGLGLAIVQRIVEAHGGTVAADNRPEGGAAVVVRLRVAARKRLGQRFQPVPAPRLTAGA